MKREHKEIVIKWFREHESRVMKMVLSERTKKMYSPSKEDLSRPSLWKTAHWKWFFAYILYN